MTVRELRQNECAESPLLRQQAGHQGWTVDDDGWFRRLRKPGDREMGAAGTLGFTTEDEVYVASCEDALRYDQGFIAADGERASPAKEG